MKSIKSIINEGAWGYNPLDSDGSLDLRDKLVDNIFTELVKRMCKTFSDKGNKKDVNILWQCIGVGIFFLDALSEKGVPFYFEKDRIENEYLTLCYEALDYLDTKSSWIDTWHDSEKIEKQLEETRKNIDKLVSKIQKQYK